MSQDHDTNGTSFDTPETWNTTISGVDFDLQLLAKGILPDEIDDVLKLHKQHGLTVEKFCAGEGGRHIEDGIDAQNRNSDCVLQDGRVGAGRKGVAITNKGGNRNMTYRRLVITAPYGRHVDLEDGNHSDQVWDKTTGTVYDEVVREDGKPVRYAWGRADRAKLLNGNYRIVWWWTAVLHLYVYAKHYFRFIP